MTTTVSVEEQMSVLMRGVEYGDANIKATMEEELRARLAEGRPLRVYCGFDPTFTDLTLGNLVPMLKMRQFQHFGHEVTFLIGTMTGIIGDPSDKTAARQMLTVEDVEANSQTWLRQAFRVLDPAKTVVKRNADWLAALALRDVVELASHFTVAQFLEHETFRNRMAEGKPLYVHEFIYALLQAYDAHHLKTDVQLGGVDQLFNILAGRQLQRALGERPLMAVTTPLLKGTDGALKMSKSVGNFVGLDEPPAEVYGKLMSIPDSLIANYFTVLVGLPDEEVAQIERGIAERTLNPMEAKKRLARSIVALLNGEAAAERAEEEFERVYQRREEPEELAVEVEWADLPFADQESLGRPETKVIAERWKALRPDDGTVVATVREKGAPISITAFVAHHSGVSRSEARRLVEQGAVTIDGLQARLPFVSVKPGSLVRIGRHTFLRISRPNGWPS